ncbi:MAG: acyl-CoA desaturase [Chloroflexi bacterium]|nr:MAG: acyl-CoA desaturase [Chloroflexota bacterium]
MTSTLARLTPNEIDAIGRELDAIRDEVIADRGERDARYIRRVIRAQRGLEIGGRALLFAGILPPAWLLGTALLSTAKILENMEIGHNVLHGQWDWMRDPSIHSTTWEWDTACSSEQWKHSHNVMHHTWTNVVGRDRDIGYSILRMDERQRWHPLNLGQPLYNVLLSVFFQWGVAFHDIEIEKVRSGEKSWRQTRTELGRMWRKARRQLLKDYVVFPALAGPFFLPVLLGNVTANLVRNVWSHAIIFCGHFPNGAETFTEDEVQGETRGGWYVRQMLGSANIKGRRFFHLMSGNLSFQIEHHCFPDLPSNRYAEIAPKVRAVCERYGLAYTTGRFTKQYGSVLWKIARLGFPSPFRRAAPAPASSAAPALSRAA